MLLSENPSCLDAFPDANLLLACFPFFVVMDWTNLPQDSCDDRIFLYSAIEVLKLPEMYRGLL